MQIPRELFWELEVLKRVYSITTLSSFLYKEVELSTAKAFCICQCTCRDNYTIETIGAN